MRRGTTPTLHLLVDDVDLTVFRSIYITFRQVGSSKQYIYDETCPNVEIYTHHVDVHLSQEETLQFNEGPVLVQIRAVTHNDIAIATEISSFSLGHILLDGVIG